MNCPHCAMSFGGCQCAPCESCGGLLFLDEFSAVHVCSSSWGELTTGIRATDMSTVKVDGYILGTSCGYLPNSPRPVHTAVLLTPTPRTVVVHYDGTPTTRDVR